MFSASVDVEKKKKKKQLKGIKLCIFEYSRKKKEEVKRWNSIGRSYIYFKWHVTIFFFSFFRKKKRLSCSFSCEFYNFTDYNA